MKFTKIVVLFALCVSLHMCAGRTVISSLHYPPTSTRILPARWAPTVPDAIMEEAISGTYHFSDARRKEAADIVAELKNLSNYLQELHAVHGDAMRGAKLTQLKIQRAITQLTRDMSKSMDRNIRAVDDAVAALYDELW